MMMNFMSHNHKLDLDGLRRLIVSVVYCFVADRESAIKDKKNTTTATNNNHKRHHSVCPHHPEMLAPPRPCVKINNSDACAWLASDGNSA